MDTEKTTTHTRPKGALGKGLSSLLPSANMSSVPEFAPRKDYFACPIEKIYPNPNQPRKRFDDEPLAELASSIKEKGILQPLVVKKTEKGYLLIAGERRWRAAQKAKLREVPVVVKDLPEREIMELALIENLQREDLNPIETAMAFEKLIIDLGLTQEEISKRVGKDRSTIANHLRLLKLPDEVKRALGDGLISEGHARSLLPLDDRDRQLQLLDEVLKKGVSVREIERRVKTIREVSGTSSPSQSSAPRKSVTPQSGDHETLERALASFLGTKVSIASKGDYSKGQIVIDFYSKEDLDRILDLIRNT